MSGFEARLLGLKRGFWVGKLARSNNWMMERERKRERGLLGRK